MSISLIILFPLVGAILNGSLALFQATKKHKVPESLVSLIGVLLPFLSFGVALKLGIPFLQGREEPLEQSLFSWITAGNFHVEAAFMLDRISVVMSLIVTGVGSLIHLYSTSYMKGEEGFARYFTYLNLFLTFMLLLVLGDNLLLLFVGWEGVGLCSYLLIGFWFDDPAKAYAGKKAFIVNRIGDFGFLIGIFLILSVLLPGVSSPTSILKFSYLSEHVSLLTPMAFLITLFLFIGATGKSAQIPLYVWLPDAMAGPTPVSALIHAATMVTAGIYMVVRLHFLYDLAPQTLHIIAVVGTVTALWAGLIALTQNDIKKVLAYSTVSQLGYMFLGLGVGAYSAGLFHVLTHAFFKALLFLGAGSVIHALSGEQDIQKMGGIRKKIPITFFTFFVATLAIAGIPPLAGFFSKDEILWQAFHHGHKVLWLLGFMTAGLTSFYMFRLVSLTFFGKSRLSHEAEHHLHESPWPMSSVLIILAILSAVAGFLGVPHALGGENWIQQWLHLEAGVHEAHGEVLSLERNLAILSAGWAALNGFFAMLIYLRFPAFPQKVRQSMRALYQLLWNKFYVDEIYDWLFVRPIRWISQVVLARGIDQGLIDGGMVNGSSRVVSGLGGVISVLQSGLANSYALYFLVGLVGFIIFLVVF